MSEQTATEEEDDFDPNDGTTPVINISSGNVKFPLDSYNHVMKAGEIRRIPTSYAIPRKMQTNAPALPSVIELLTGRPPQVVPVTHKLARGRVEELRKAGKLPDDVAAFIEHHDRREKRKQLAREMKALQE